MHSIYSDCALIKKRLVIRPYLRENSTPYTKGVEPRIFHVLQNGKVNGNV